MRHRAASVAAVLYPEETRSLGGRRSNDAVLPPDEVPPPGPSPDFEGVQTGCLRHAEVDPDGEVVGVTARAPPHFVDPAAFAQGVFGRETQGLRDEAERVEEVALAGTVRSDEKRERRQRDVASGDALVVAQGDARDRDGTGCIQRFAAFVRTHRAPAAASAARAAISSSVSVLSGWRTTTGSRRPAPSAVRCASASRRNASVTMTAVGTPRPSRPTVSCRLHDVHDPQSPIAVITASFSAAIRSSSSASAGREKLGFV